MFQRYMLRSLLTQSFNIVNTPIILLFSKKWVPGFAAEDNTSVTYRRVTCTVADHSRVLLHVQQVNGHITLYNKHIHKTSSQWMNVK